MRITFVLHGFFRRPIGGARVIYGHASRLAERGHRVAVIHPLKPPAEPWALPAKEKIKKVVAGAWAAAGGPAKQMRPAWCRLDERVQSLLVPSLHERYLPKADAVVATSWNTAAPVAALPDTRGRKFYFIHEIETSRGPEADVLASYRLPLGRIVINRATERALEQMGCPTAGRVPNSFESDRFGLRAPVEGRTGVGMMFSEAPIKGSADGLEAMRRAGIAEPHLFGSGNPPSAARFLESPDDEALAGFYNSLAIFVQPSWIEGWGLPAFEAMGCGCALAATATDGIVEFAEHGKTALLSPPHDPAALAENLRRLLSDEALRVRLARAGAERVLGFSWATASETLEKLLS